MKLINTICALFFMAALLSGCSSNTTKDGLPDGQNTLADSGYNTIDADGTKITEINLDKNISAAEALMQTAEFSDPSSPLSRRVIYFEYDSSQVINEFIPIIEAHGHYLMANPNQRITLEGHSDERGTREYNIALAEQRAKAVYKMLQLIGVMGKQVDIVSYGEEKPVELEHNDDAYALNRRVELVYK